MYDTLYCDTPCPTPLGGKKSEKIKILLREGGKKHLRKKNIKHIFEEDNEGDEIKKTLDNFLETLMRATQ